MDWRRRRLLRYNGLLRPVFLGLCFRGVSLLAGDTLRILRDGLAIQFTYAWRDRVCLRCPTSRVLAWCALWPGRGASGKATSLHALIGRPCVPVASIGRRLGSGRQVFGCESFVKFVPTATAADICEPGLSPWASSWSPLFRGPVGLPSISGPCRRRFPCPDARHVVSSSRAAVRHQFAGLKREGV
ncbi:hypothetical protein J5N97_027107 [Dioscorea zingiberensis]|uniref:Uncharacterized protein n=1 Tax=Dioscorea zingiberensis TaxID=325984 RepID=A0A9D5C4M8_9LILI|nr:hypothetical protein J5N97_027107 [Dioscorea zingiberensis]